MKVYSNDVFICDCCLTRVGIHWVRFPCFKILVLILTVLREVQYHRLTCSKLLGERERGIEGERERGRKRRREGKRERERERESHCHTIFTN